MKRTPMPRTTRQIIPNAPYHALNRSNGRFQIFESARCYERFCRLIGLAVEKHQMRLIAFCIMPNHWHMILRPESAAQLSKFMGWLCNTHTRRYHITHQSVGQGPLYQGRYKAILLTDDRQLSTAVRYVERNPVTSALASSAASWPWSSAAATGRSLVELCQEPFQEAHDWQMWVDDALTAKEYAQSNDSSD